MMVHYGRRYYAKREGDRRHFNTAVAIDEVCHREGVPVGSVLDVGCASGCLLAEFRGLHDSARLVGVDHGSIPAERFILAKDPLARLVDIDLDAVRPEMTSDCLAPEAGFDVVSCVEVIEHVDPKNEVNLVGFLAGATGGRLFLSAAHPGQRGYGHVNCASREHWVSLFAKAGAVLLPGPTERFGAIMEALGAGDKRNLMVFGKERKA